MKEILKSLGLLLNKWFSESTGIWNYRDSPISWTVKNKFFANEQNTGASKLKLFNSCTHKAEPLVYWEIVWTQTNIVKFEYEIICKVYKWGNIFTRYLENSANSKKATRSSGIYYRVAECFEIYTKVQKKNIPLTMTI